MSGNPAGHKGSNNDELRLVTVTAASAPKNGTTRKMRNSQTFGDQCFIFGESRICTEMYRFKERQGRVRVHQVISE